MPFKIIRNDITKVKADAIVNTANPLPTIGRGIDYAIYKAAGLQQLLEARKKIGRLARGQAVSTPAFKLNAKYIIHAIGPVWEGGDHGERDILHDCYRNSLNLAAELSCKSIAFPLIATGSYGFPKDEALQIALSEINRFLLENDMRVILVVFDETAFELSGKLMEDIEEFIDGEAERQIRLAEYGTEDPYNWRRGTTITSQTAYRRLATANHVRPAKQEPRVSKDAPVVNQTLEDAIANTGDTFQQRLFKLIDERGLKDSDVYHKALMSKQLFSKIRGDENYRPKKKTAVALALALELDLPTMLDLLQRAEIALSPSSKFDSIITYYVTHKKYNIIEINATLFEYGEPLLGY